MKKILRHSFHITRWTIACMIIVASLMLVTARTMTSYIEDYANNMMGRLSIVLGVPVSVDAVSAEWQGLGPSVFLTGVRLGEGESLSTISSIIVKPDVVSSLVNWGIIWSRFEVSEMDVSLEELPSGRWSFAGIELGGGGGGAYLEEMILESNRISVQQAKFNIRSLLGNQFELNVHDMSLDYALAFHRLKLAADFGKVKNQLEFIAEFTGSRFLDLDGLAYLKIDGHDIGYLYESLQKEFWPDIDLNGQNGQETPSVKVELWANFRAGKEIEWQGSAALDKIPGRLLGYKSETPRILTDLTGAYSAQQQFLNLQNTEVEFYSDTIELPDLRVSRSLNASEVGYDLTLPSIQASELLDSLSRLPVFAGEGMEKVLALNPAGEVSLLVLEVPNLDLSRWQLSGQLTSFDIDNFRTAPAVKNLSGSFVLDSDGGVMHVDAEEVSLFYPKVYDHWLKHDSVQGTVSWQLDLENKNLLVFADAVSVLGDHGPVEGAFLVDVPLQQLDHPMGVDITLFIGIIDTSVAQKDNLMPSSLPKNLTAWLDKAVLAGNVPEAGFVYRGSTKRSQPSKRTAQLRLTTTDGGLQYADRWPKLTGLDAEIWVSDAYVNGSATSARLLDLELVDISVEAKPLIKNGKKTTQLKVISIAEGASNTFLSLIRDYQLRDQIGDSLDILEIQGAAKAAISLQLPTRKDLVREDIDVQIHANLLNNQLELSGKNLKLDDIQGALNYDSAGLYGDGISATLWDRPLQLALSEDASEGLLNIDVQGSVEVKDVSDWLGLDFLNRLEGVTDVAGRIEIATRSKNNRNDRYHFWTDMEGVASGFPEPFTKSLDKATPLEIQVELGDLMVTSLGWDILEGDNLAVGSEASEFLFELSQYSRAQNLTVQKEHSETEPAIEGFHSGRLSFQNALPEVSEGVFSGRINIADIDIAECLDAYESEFGSKASENGEDVYESVYGRFLGLKPDFSLVVDSLGYSGTNFGKVKAYIGFEPNVWKINLEADYGSGSLHFFEEKQPPLANITSMDLNRVKSLFDSQKNESNAVNSNPLDPRDIPHLRVNVESITLNDVERGNWNGTLSPTENGLWIGDLQGGLDSALLALEEPGSTLFWGQDSNGYYTELDLTFEYEDISDLFRLMDIDPPLDSKSGVLYTSLNWDGAPYEFSEAVPSGIMGIDALNGAFHTGNSKVPNTLLKTIGLINVGSWVRRLRLDFNDMTASGTPYNQIVGDFVIEGDQITTLTPVDIELSSGSMLFDGVIDLDQEEVDARLVVTLPARQNVTWVAALVAGLPAAAGVWLAGKIFDDELDSLSSVSYKVEGALDDPKVSAEKMFESTITK